MKTTTVIVLAAGEGKRMKSSTPKVLHPLWGRPMLEWVLLAAEGMGRARRRAAVLGRGGDEVAALLKGRGWESVRQEKRLGTGHAVRLAMEALKGVRGNVMVLSGDTPLLKAATLRKLLAGHGRAGAAMTMLSARLADPSGYGRVLRDGAGRVMAVVEQKELGRRPPIDEVNAGVYVFDAGFLLRHLPALKRHARSGEYYLTDLVEAAMRSGTPARAVTARDAGEIAGVNSRRQLAEAADVLRRRILDRLMDGGVTVTDPAFTYVGPEVRVGRDTVIAPGVTLEGRTVVGRACRLGPHARVSDSRLGDGSEVRDGSVVEGARIGVGATVGPMARLRPGTAIGAGARVGNFVEVKKSRLASGVKASHLTYLGDAVVGRGANIGAGTITCNYDGVKKHATIIGAGAFIGSDTMLVAPVRIGRGAVTGAGSTITRDVPDGALAVERSAQKVRPGWAAGRRTRRRAGRG